MKISRYSPWSILLVMPQQTLKQHFLEQVFAYTITIETSKADITAKIVQNWAESKRETRKHVYQSAQALSLHERLPTSKVKKYKR